MVPISYFLYQKLVFTTWLIYYLCMYYLFYLRLVVPTTCICCVSYEWRLLLSAGINFYEKLS